MKFNQSILQNEDQSIKKEIVKKYEIYLDIQIIDLILKINIF